MSACSEDDCFFLSSDSCINSIFCVASFSDLTTSAILPGSGVSLIHNMSIGSHHVAFVIAFPVQSSILFTLPYVLWTTTISPIFNVPVMIMSEVSIPCFADFFASITTPTAFLLALYFSSNTSACSVIISNKSFIPWPVTADTPIIGVSPPRSSGMISYFHKSAFICSILSAPGLSIFVIATIMGTPDSLAWFMDSMVCGISPSSAATTMTTMSVSFAPLALMVVNNSCPGVSMKVIFFLS